MTDAAPTQTPGGNGGGSNRGGDNRGKAIAALVLGIVAGVIIIIPVVNYLSPILAIAAIVLGVQANKQANALGGANKGKAITGMVFGIISLALFVLIVIAGVAFLSSDTGQQLLEEAEQQSAPAVAVTV